MRKKILRRPIKLKFPKNQPKSKTKDANKLIREQAEKRKQAKKEQQELNKASKKARENLEKQVKQKKKPKSNKEDIYIYLKKNDYMPDEFFQLKKLLVKSQI